MCTVNHRCQHIQLLYRINRPKSPYLQRISGKQQEVALNRATEAYSVFYNAYKLTVWIDTDYNSAEYFTEYKTLSQ